MFTPIFPVRYVKRHLKPSQSSKKTLRIQSKKLCVTEIVFVAIFISCQLGNSGWFQMTV